MDALGPVLMAPSKKVRLLEYNVIWSNEIEKPMISRFLVSTRILFVKTSTLKEKLKVGPY